MPFDAALIRIDPTLIDAAINALYLSALCYAMRLITGSWGWFKMLGGYAALCGLLFAACAWETPNNAMMITAIFNRIMFLLIIFGGGICILIALLWRGAQAGRRAIRSLGSDEVS